MIGDSVLVGLPTPGSHVYCQAEEPAAPLRCILTVLARLLNTGRMLEPPCLTRSNKPTTAGACSLRGTAGRQEEADLDTNWGRRVNCEVNGRAARRQGGEGSPTSMGWKTGRGFSQSVWKNQVGTDQVGPRPPLRPHVTAATCFHGELRAQLD